MITVGTSGLDDLARRLRDVVSAVSDTTPARKLIGILGVRAWQNNFRAQKDEDGTPWPRLKYRVGTPLVDKLGRMPKGVTYALEGKNTVRVAAGYATRAYNAIHNYGGQAGRNHATTIPRRQYAYFSQRDRDAMVREVRAFVARAMSGRA